MKFIYSIILVIGTLIFQAFTLPINNNIFDLGPAIVVKQHKPILYNPVENTTEIEPAIVPPPPPPAPPGPIDDIMPTKFVLPDGNILYTPKDIKPFIISPFSDLEPLKPTEA